MKDDNRQAIPIHWLPGGRVKKYKSTLVGLTAMATAAGIWGTMYGLGPALIATGIVFYLWGVCKAYVPLNKNYEAACEKNPWFAVSEFYETGYMIWFVFSWLAYLVVREPASK